MCVKSPTWQFYNLQHFFFLLQIYENVDLMLLLRNESSQAFAHAKILKICDNIYSSKLKTNMLGSLELRVGI